MWGSQGTFHPTVDLIDRIARDHGRTQLMDELVPLPQAVNVPFEADAQGRVKLRRPRTSARRAVALAHTLQRIIRKLAREDGARLIRQADVVAEKGSVRREVTIVWAQQKAPVVQQIEKLERAINTTSTFKIEAAWFGLTERAHEYLGNL